MRNTILTGLMVAAAAAFTASTPASTPAPTTTSSRCIDLKPICEPGKHPICKRPHLKKTHEPEE